MSPGHSIMDFSNPVKKSNIPKIYVPYSVGLEMTANMLMATMSEAGNDVGHVAALWVKAISPL